MQIIVRQNKVFLSGSATLESTGGLYKRLLSIVDSGDYTEYQIDLSDLSRIDSSGVVLLDEILDHASQKEVKVELIHVPEKITKALNTFSSRSIAPQSVQKKTGWLERMGEKAHAYWQLQKNAIFLAADSFYFSFLGLFSRKGAKKGEFINQSILIGMNAFPIVALISFLIGFILSLQSAAQLRHFGASIYIADLVSISMTREMGPIMTAILFAGRSGSSIASEIATMVVTEETDALKAMGLNPIRYTLVPKIHAITLMMPLLTILSMILGILGAFVIGVTYLDVGVSPFYNQVIQALVLKDILTGLVKSIIFAWIIVMVGAFYGFRVRGGAADVGRMTTASVVASIFLVILADSILGLLFYFNIKSGF
ncbi:MAG: MlaE family lipid ABC transporter permease subunit [candidate division KSB1 bacterium]|nr:MlaE family lipid ABC transporter permease subunit [candidate division KSB1 bacterium]